MIFLYNLFKGEKLIDKYKSSSESITFQDQTAKNPSIDDGVNIWVFFAIGVA